MPEGNRVSDTPLLRQLTSRVKWLVDNIGEPGGIGGDVYTYIANVLLEINTFQKGIVIGKEATDIDGDVGPGISITQAENTGGVPGNNAIQVHGGIQAATSGVIAPGPGNGGYSFEDDPDTGMFSPMEKVVRFIADGTQFMKADGNNGDVEITFTGLDLFGVGSDFTDRIRINVGGNTVMILQNNGDIDVFGRLRAANISPVATKTANHTLTSDDLLQTVEMNLAGANTLTVPPNSSVAFTVGSIIRAAQVGAGVTTVTPGVGVTIESLGGLTNIAGQHGVVHLQKRATDTWRLWGDLA